MISQPRILASISIVIGLLAMSMIYLKIEDPDYKTAISIGEKKFDSFKLNRDDYKLVEIKNDMVKNNGENWRLTYLTQTCISKAGLRTCLGGEVFITVNVKTGEAKVTWGE